MIAFTFWIKSPAARETAGPITFPELRALLHSGLVTGDTLLADDDFLYHPLREFTELWQALHDPSVADVERRPASRLAGREDAGRERDATTAAPILNPKAEDVVDFEAVRRGERGYSTYDVLALNRSKEPEKVIRQLPWYKRSRMVDLRRWAPFAIILISLIVLRIPHKEEDFPKDPIGMTGVVGEFAFYYILLTGSFWYFFAIDYHWHGKGSDVYRDTKDSLIKRVLSRLKK